MAYSREDSRADLRTVSDRDDGWTTVWSVSNWGVSNDLSVAIQSTHKQL